MLLHIKRFCYDLLAVFVLLKNLHKMAAFKCAVSTVFLRSIATHCKATNPETKHNPQLLKRHQALVFNAWKTFIART